MSLPSHSISFGSFSKVFRVILTIIGSVWMLMVMHHSLMVVELSNSILLLDAFVIFPILQLLILSRFSSSYKMIRWLILIPWIVLLFYIHYFKFPIGLSVFYTIGITLLITCFVSTYFLSKSCQTISQMYEFMLSNEESPLIKKSVFFDLVIYNLFYTCTLLVRQQEYLSNIIIIQWVIFVHLMVIISPLILGMIPFHIKLKAEKEIKGTRILAYFGYYIFILITHLISWIVIIQFEPILNQTKLMIICVNFGVIVPILLVLLEAISIHILMRGQIRITSDLIDKGFLLKSLFVKIIICIFLIILTMYGTDV